MTNEEAIKRLESFRDYLCAGNPIWDVNEVAEVFDKAIEALRRQDQALNEWCTDCKEYDNERHCCPRFNRVIESAIKDATDTNVGDTVSRQAAIVTLHDEILRRRLNHTEPIDEFDTESILRQLPSVKPEQDKPVRLSTVCLRCGKPAVTFRTDDDIPYTNYSYCEDCLRKGLKLLRKLPSAEPQERRGKWIRVDNLHMRCNHCDVIHLIAQYPRGNIDYCPNCGFKMEVEND